MKKNTAKEIAEGITVDPGVMVGKPVIKGTRMPVELVLAKLSANPDINDLLIDYPHLTVEQIKDCLRYAAKLATRKRKFWEIKDESDSVLQPPL